jgi:hypothetical protein
MMANLYTLRFSSPAQLKTIAQNRGFWDDVTDSLITDGQYNDTVEGRIRGRSWAYQGREVITPAVLDANSNVITPAVMSSYVVLIVSGRLPLALVSPFLDPRGYGYSGLLFAGTQPGPHPTT